MHFGSRLREAIRARKCDCYAFKPHRVGVLIGVRCLAGPVWTAHPWRMALALGRRYRLLGDRCPLPVEPIRGLLVSSVLTLHSSCVGVVLLQCSDEERNVIVGNVEFHSAFLSPGFPRSDSACRPLAAAERAVLS